jgi:hypothetical protein
MISLLSGATDLVATERRVGKTPAMRFRDNTLSVG